MADDIKLLSSIVKELQESNQKAGEEVAAAKENVAEIKALVGTNEKAIKQAMRAGNVDLQKSLQAQQSQLSQSLEDALAKETETEKDLSVSDATDTAFIAQVQETFGGLQQASAEIYQKQEDITSQLEQNYVDVLTARMQLKETEDAIAEAKEKKDFEAWNRLVKEKDAITQTIADLNQSSESLGTTLKDNNQMLDALGLDQTDESIIEEDPNEVPAWALEMNNHLSLANMFSKEGFSALGDKLSNFSLGDLPGAAAVSSVFDVFADLAKKAFMLLGGFTAFQGFLDGMKKTAEWFNGDTGPLETIAAGITGILMSFGIIDEENAAEMANKINNVFHWIKDKVVWMFEGVKKTVGGIVNFFLDMEGVVDTFKKEGIIAGLGALWDNIKDNLLDNLTWGALAAFALLKPKMALSLVGFVVKTLIPKLVGMLASGIGPMLAPIGSALASAGSALMAAVAPLAVAAAPFIAIAAAVALVIYGLVEGFKEGLAVFEETGSILEGLKAGISKMIGTILGFVPDLLKDIVSWAARKLGFDGFADTLDSFSFTDMITDAFRSVYNWFELLPLKLGKAILGFLKGVPGLGRFIKDDHIAAIDAKIAEKEQKFEATDAAVEKRRAEKAEEERLEKLEKQKEEGEEEKLEKPKQEGEEEKLEKPKEEEEEELKALEQQALEFEPAPAQQIIQNANIDFNIKPITDGLKSVEKAIKDWMNSVDAEMSSSNKGTTLVSAPKTSQTINRQTTAVSAGLGHRNIGATRGMFGAPTSPLSSPN